MSGVYSVASAGRVSGRRRRRLNAPSFLSLSFAVSQTYWWHDKYRPRKPRYFNRVKTGYDWNKYNQTHYDHDNPPPKTVQVGTGFSRALALASPSLY